MRKASRELARHTHGFTLVELMVGLVISMLLLIVISSFYLSQRASYGTHTDLAGIQENARAIAQLLQRDVRQAGYNDFPAGTTFANANTIDATNDTGTNTSDTLTFRYFGSDALAAAASVPTPNPDGTIVDCTGKGVSNIVLQAETFSIANDASGMPWLQCTANGTTTPLFPGVERFQVLLGEDTDGDQAINRYVPPGVAVMANVRAMVVSVVLVGDSLSNPAPVSATLNHFGTAYAPANVAPASDAGSVVQLPVDGRLRKNFTFYIAVRNRLN